MGNEVLHFQKAKADETQKNKRSVSKQFLRKHATLTKILISQLVIFFYKIHLRQNEVLGTPLPIQ